MRPLLHLSQYGAHRNIFQSTFIMSNVKKEIASVKMCIQAAEKKLASATSEEMRLEVQKELNLLIKQLLLQQGLGETTNAAVVKTIFLIGSDGGRKRMSFKSQHQLDRYIDRNELIGLLSVVDGLNIDEHVDLVEGAEYELMEKHQSVLNRVGEIEVNNRRLVNRRENEFAEALVKAAAQEEGVPVSDVVNVRPSSCLPSPWPSSLSFLVTNHFILTT